MGSFYDVTAGNATLAADVNQYADRFNGVTSVQAKFLSQNNATSVLQAILSSAPTVDQSVLDVLVSGDYYTRISAYIRSADGYGGIEAGAGPGAQTAHLYAQSFGWQIPEALHVAGALTGGSIASSGSLSAVGNASLDNGAFTSDGAGHLSAVSLALASITVQAPPILASGYQETGPCGRNFSASVAGQVDAYFVNFKTHMTHVPTSITLTATGGSGNGTVSAQAITADGFLFVLTATVAGTSHWYGTYTTVGN